MKIQTEDHGPIRVIRLNRPEVFNALDPDAIMQFRAALIGFRDDDTALVAILTGAGDKAFCAGADLKNTSPPDSAFASSYFSALQTGVDNGSYVRAMVWDDLGLTKPIIAAVNGHALGGGLELALQCDLRIASSNATFGLPEARWASVPGAGGVSNLLRAVPRAVAMKIALTGDRIDAAEALRVGLVSDVVESDRLPDLAQATAQRIVANGPLAVRAITAMSRTADDVPLSRSIAIEQMLWGALRDTDDRAEGRRAFGDKRKPTYRGR
ncbi:enoyl-CoA hydratase-related protein [Nocardia sp. NPDC052112]|uniref:enoyl-CoA hydratase/isomerase family protein n=1 Tax=Nocardia sp. NPDC052112 TaxID=3155646 RepID=UPI00344322BA